MHPDEATPPDSAGRADIERILAANRYLVLGTTGDDGRPWVTPVFFARVDADRLCWVSSPGSRHSRSIGGSAPVALTVFDSTVAVGHAEAAYFEAVAAPADDADRMDALSALNARLPDGRTLDPDDLAPAGPMVAYVARIRRRYILVRGGNPEHGNTLDISYEV